MGWFIYCAQNRKIFIVLIHCFCFPLITLGKKGAKVIKQAIKEWEKMTCIRFKLRKKEKDYAYFFPGEKWATSWKSLFIYLCIT